MTLEAQIIFKAILDTEERYGASMIAAIVGGVGTDRIRRAGYDRLSVFGALSGVDEKEIKGYIKQFIALGYLESSLGKYPTLSITSGGEAVLAGTQRVIEARREIVRVRPEAPRRTKTSAGAKGGLFEHLRQHRKKLAEEAGIPPYLIFSDTVLIDMASLRPKTLAELCEIKGIGEAKLKRYGLSFLQAIAEGERK